MTRAPRSPIFRRAMSLGRVTRSIAWLRLAAATIATALSPLLDTESQRLRFALFAGLVWLPWAWIALLLAERERDRWRRAAEFAGDFGIVTVSQLVFPSATVQVLSGFIAVVLVHGLILMRRTIALHRKTSVLLAESEQRLVVLLEQMPMLLWTTDPELVVTSWIGARGGTDGLVPEDPIGTNLDDRLASRYAEFLEAHHIALGGEAADCEITLDLRTYQASVRPLRDSFDRVSGVVGAALDITDRKVAEEAKTMFLATASHELKTPLTVIRGFAETLQARADLDDEMKSEALDAIVRRSQELSKIVDRLLLSGRIEAGRVKVFLERVAPAQIMQERCRSLEQSTGRRVITKLDPKVCDALVDPAAYATIIDHLLDNAAKYAPGDAPIAASLSTDGDRVVVAVSDSGIGMSKEQMDKCFEKFWQADGSDRRRFGGTGIGLYIVRSLAEAMGGTVWAESSSGLGSTFYFAVPSADALRPNRLLDRSEPGVGDSSVIREFMRQMGVPGGGGV